MALISIHALREEGDATRQGFFASTMQFLSTPSARRATAGWSYGLGLRYISIHALREEGDGCAVRYTAAAVEISIHALREEGDEMERGAGKYWVFISIHALREEGDREVLLRCRSSAISIHALREEGDPGIPGTRATT